MSDNLPAAIKLQNDAKALVERRDTPDSTINVRSLVVTALADAEIKRRTEVLRDALDKRAKLDGEIRKIKPTLSMGINPETEKEEKRFTKADAEAKKKLSDKLTKLDGVITGVLETPSAETYGKLKDVASKV